MNRYIKAMEIGNANEKEGISYLALIKELEDQLGYKLGYSAELTFMEWFHHNFKNDISSLDYYNNVSKLRDYQSKRDRAIINDEKTKNAEMMERLLNQKFFLNGEASKQYLDYVELKESREAATQARKQSNYSITIAIGAIFVSILLGICSIFSSPNPPFDVKVIEDKTRTKNLEQENKELGEKLYEAEIMIRILKEGDSTNVS